MSQSESSGRSTAKPSRRRWRLFALILIGLSLLVADQLVFVIGWSWTHGVEFERSPEVMRSTVRRKFLLWQELASKPKAPDQFVIGVFGGSVAASLADSDQLARVPEVDRLQAKLGKQLRIVRLAFGGGAQPSQYYLLNQFHDRIDAVIMLDGFNEMTERGREGCELYGRSYEIRKEVAESYQALQDEVAALDRRLSSWWWPVLMRSGTYRLIERRESVRLSRLEQLSLSRWLPHPWEQGVGPAVELWSNCVAASAAFAKEKKLPAFFFLQPNQYVQGSKPLSKEEQKRAIRPLNGSNSVDTTMRELTSTYAALEQKISTLQTQGVQIESLANVFRDVPDTVYVDDCCHVNVKGNKLMAERIMKRVVDALLAAPVVDLKAAP